MSEKNKDLEVTAHEDRVVQDNRSPQDIEHERRRLKAARGGTPDTRKLNLDRTYTYAGAHYGPGVVAVPTENGAADAIELKQMELQAAGRMATPTSEINYAEQRARIEVLDSGQENPGAGDSIASRGGAPDVTTPGKLVTSVPSHPADPEGKNPGGAADPNLGIVKDGKSDPQEKLDKNVEKDRDKEQKEAADNSADNAVKTVTKTSGGKNK